MSRKATDKRIYIADFTARNFLFSLKSVGKASACIARKMRYMSDHNVKQTHAKHYTVHMSKPMQELQHALRRPTFYNTYDIMQVKTIKTC